MFATLLCIAAPSVIGQTLKEGMATVPPQQCQWRAGATPPWVEANSGSADWKPYADWKMNPHEPYVWMHCSIQTSVLSGLEHPAIQVSLPAAYEIRLDNDLIARNGNMTTGGFTLDTVRTWTIPPVAIPAPETIGGTSTGTPDLDLRIVYSSRSQWQWGSGLATDPGPVDLEVGEQNRLTDARAGQIASNLPEALLGEGPMMLMGIVGFVLLIIWLPDRGQPAPILFAIYCILVSIVFGEGLLATVEVPIAMSLVVLLSAVARAGNAVAISMVPFVLAGRRIPLLIWVLVGIAACAGLAPISALPMSPGTSLALNSQFASVAAPAFFVSFALLSFSPFLAFRPYRKIPRGLGWIAVVLMIDGSARFLWFVRVVLGDALSPLLGASLSSSVVFQSSVASGFAALAALIALMLRRQRRVASQRAEFAGEMQAARHMQRVLVGESIESLPAIRIEAAFYPAREVGGDFYSCRVLTASRQRILIGDVSGKGAAAAMTAAVLLGATLRRDSDSPAALLDHLNRGMTEMTLGGFATCLCAELSADGVLAIANAGHLAPYRNGEEISLQTALPLGIDPNVTYSESTIRLNPSDQLTFISDGVVEARSPSGELFGFERTGAISGQPAETIAQRAQQFGQEDDITVLTLSWEGRPSPPLAGPSRS